MDSLTIRNLDDAVMSRLIVRAARHGRSIEAEALEILREALPEALPEETEPSEELASNLAERIRRRIEPLGGVDLEIPPREPGREPPKF